MLYTFHEPHWSIYWPIIIFLRKIFYFFFLQFYRCVLMCIMSSWTIYILIQYIWYRCVDKYELSSKPWKPLWKKWQYIMKDVFFLLYGDILTIVKSWFFQILVSTVESVHLILYREIFITLILSKASVIQQKNWCLWCDEDLKLARNLVKLYSTDKENIGRKIIFTIYFTWYVVIFIMLFVVLYFHMYATCICVIFNNLIKI